MSEAKIAPNDAAYLHLEGESYLSSELTRGPWDMGHQHAGPPIALVTHSLEKLAATHGLHHMARLTSNLYRPIPIAKLTVKVAAEYVGRNAGHFSASLFDQGKEVMRCTALFQREAEVELPANLPGHPLPKAAKSADSSLVKAFPFLHDAIGYPLFMETREAIGTMFQGPSSVWFRMRYPLVKGCTPSGYERVAVAADSGNGISAVLDFGAYLFVNSDLTINLIRKPVGEWICVDARSHLSSHGGGLAESALYDEEGLIGRATQSLFLRKRDQAI